MAEGLTKTPSVFQAIFDHAPAPMAAIDVASGQIKALNARFAAECRRPINSLHGQNFYSLMKGDARAAVEDAAARSINELVEIALTTRGYPSTGAAIQRLTLSPLPSPDHDPALVLVTIRDGLAREVEAELLKEIAHRARNLVTIIQIMARHAEQVSSSAVEFDQAFSPRLESLLKTANLVAESGPAIDLGALIRRQLRSFVPLETPRVTLQGEKIGITTAEAQNLGMAIFELGLRSSQSGGLADVNGALAVSWREEGAEAPQLVIEWTERRSAAPMRPMSSFSQMVCEEMLVYALGAAVRITTHDGGFEWRFAAPRPPQRHRKEYG